MERQDGAARLKLWSMIKKYRFAMMTTRHGGEELRSRPMTTVEREQDAALWFFASGDSEVANDIRAHPEVCLSYGDPDTASFVSVAGRAAAVSDVAQKRELWNPVVQAWFPEGAESARVVLIKVTANHAEYWDSKNNSVVQLFTMAKALTEGVPPRDMCEHRGLEMPAADGASIRTAR